MPSLRRVLPVGPLLRAFRCRGTVRAHPERDAVVVAARSTWLTQARLDATPPEELAEDLIQFYRAVLPVPWHEGVVRRRVGLVRHGLNHMLRGDGPVGARFARCAAVGGPYHLPGLGPTFWAAVAKALDPDRHPLFAPTVYDGLVRLGMANAVVRESGARWAAAARAYEGLVAEHGATADELDEFLPAVATMAGRELGSVILAPPLAQELRALRTACPLKRRIEQAQAEPHVYTEAARHGLAVIDDAFDDRLSPDEQADLLKDVQGTLRKRLHVHPCEVAPLLEAVGEWGAEPASSRTTARQFSGFCADTFRFLADLAEHNDTDWMAAERDRYRFAVREPLVELCAELAARYVRPVLGGEYGWDIETDPRPGRGLTSIAKTDFGRGGPYVPMACVTFARRRPGPRRDDVQFFVRADADGVAVGVRLGRRAREAGRLFRTNVQEHGGQLFAALKATGALAECRFGAEPSADGATVRTSADLREWAAGKELAAYRWFPHGAPVLRSDDFVGEALILFDRLVPLFAAAVEPDPRRILGKRAGTPDGGPGFGRDAFRAATGLGEAWLGRALDLLHLKKQLVLQGVPGTGKTHVARCLARHLTGDRSECVRLVQFHPGYSYEEFVEGIRPRSVEANGTAQVTYPVEPGVLATFAARAAAHPADPHVLVIDELNRGNLPRVFGELLFLLEYRDQEVTLPYSKAGFRLPANLYLVGTMNPADRSAVPLDQAMRRRFSFIDMPPDAAVLARWFEAHPPADADESFGPRVVRWFEDANRRLVRDVGADRQIGHSFFMLPELTREQLAAVWEHHVRPALDDVFPGRPDRVAALDPARAFDRKRRAAAGAGP